MDRYAVFGNPIEHSKSPRIHALFAEQTSEAITYDRCLIALDGFAEEAGAFFALGGRGLNVTVPFKEQAMVFADATTERGRIAGALNTLALQADGSVLGDNTDGAGLLHDLNRLQWLPRSQRVLVIGAGGAVRGILQPLLDAKPEVVTLVNRTPAKAAQLARELSAFGSIQTCEFGDLDAPFDLIINGTSSSLHGDLPPLPDVVVGGATRAYDLMYAATPTRFMTWAQALGAKSVSDGLGMLVGQAAEAFYLWRGKMPEIEPVLASLRAEMQ